MQYILKYIFTHFHLFISYEQKPECYYMTHFVLKLAHKWYFGIIRSEEALSIIINIDG